MEELEVMGGCRGESRRAGSDRRKMENRNKKEQTELKKTFYVLR